MRPVSRILKEWLARNPQRDDPDLLTSLTKKCLSVQHVVYHGVALPKLTRVAPYLHLTYDKEWTAHYTKKNYFRIDPVVNNVLLSLLPVRWGTLDWAERSAQVVAGEAADFGILLDGLSVPIRGPGGQLAIFSVTSFDDPFVQLFIDENMADILLLAHYFHEAVLNKEGVATSPIRQQLTPREKEILGWAAIGKNMTEIAEILGISYATARMHGDSARYKLGASNRTHAVTIAIANGLIIHPYPL